MLTYLFVSKHESSSSNKIYTVKVQLDNKIGDEVRRAKDAFLTCDCPGWTRRCNTDRYNHSYTIAGRDCRHVRVEQNALTEFASIVVRKPSSLSDHGLLNGHTELRVATNQLTRFSFIEIASD